MPGIDDTAKKRLPAGRQGWRRRLLRRHRGALELGQQADDHIERLLIRRFERLSSVRRFVLLWISLFVLLIFITIIQVRGLSKYYQQLVPVAGGVYAEGIVGSFTNANPFYAAGTADTAVSRLVFSGLFKYNDDNVLVPDLASGYRLNDNQTIYSVDLRKNVKWQDGKPFTADDVVFTYQTLQNAASESPLYSSWRDINVSKAGKYSVNFQLPNALSSFPYSLTNGIVPWHLLKNIPVEQLRTASFNTDPVGTGPFEWKFAEVSGTTTDDRQQRISLAQNSRYWAGRPKLDGFSLIVFANEQQMIRAFEKKQINAMSGLETMPDALASDNSLMTYNTPLTSEVMAFFNDSHTNLGDVNIRRALSSAVDRKQIENLLPYSVKLADEPLLKGQLGYDASLTEVSYNSAQAGQLLDQAGWPLGAGGLRYKNGQPLQFNLISQNTAQYTRVAQFLQKAWTKIGVKIAVHYFSSDDLQSQAISAHDYDILLYGITIGVDPDEYAYWDSSQASLASQGHLNLSEYKSTAADQALEGARTRSDSAVRAAKYKGFLTSWSQDAPALALYQPNFLYITRGPVFGYSRKSDNGSADRFYNVTNWAIRQKNETIN